jgi:hypothetical protein
MSPKDAFRASDAAFSALVEGGMAKSWMRRGGGPGMIVVVVLELLYG